MESKTVWSKRVTHSGSERVRKWDERVETYCRGGECRCRWSELSKFMINLHFL